MADEVPFTDINPDKLDEEWLEQPRRFVKYARRLAHAKLTLNEAKAELNVVEADLFFRIKQNWQEYNLEKAPSDKFAELAVHLQPEHKKALEAYNNAQHDVDILDAAVKALDHRKKALESLVYLHGQGYFATPRVKGDQANGAIDRAEVRKPLRDRGDDD